MEERLFFEEFFHNSVKSAADSLQFGKLTSVSEAKNFHNNVKAQIDVKFRSFSNLLRSKEMS